MNHEKETILNQILLADDWESRMRRLIQLGALLETIPETLRERRKRLHNCQSEVWFAVVFDPVRSTLHFYGESDARIVKGLMAFLFLFCQDQSPARCLELDFESLLSEYQLQKHLSSSRGNGLKELILQIREQAQAMLC